MTLVRTTLAAALALAALPAAAQTYSQTIFFGDSLTDAGYYRPLLPASVRSVTGQFTTNPGLVWSQYLADFYGTAAAPNGNGQTGTNYAAGGARVGVDTVGALGPQPSLATQVSRYLTANGGRADANALYSVWGGANDLFAITNAGAPPTTTISSAVAAEVGIVSTLQGAGARYVLVATVPDLGLTPAFRAQGATAQAQGTALSTSYNDALFGALAGNNLRVIPLNTFALLREVAANPSAFGFSNITGTACQPQITANSLTCNPTSYVTPNAADTYLFADGVHPTSSAHAAVADYAVSVLEGPRQIALLTNSAVSTGRGRAAQVLNHAGKPSADGMRGWADVRGDFQRYGHGDVYDGVGPALTAGIDWNRGNLVFGGFAGYGRSQLDWGLRGGSWDQDEGTLGGFVGWYGDGAWVTGQLSYTQLSFDTERRVQLGRGERVHTGSADGDNVSVGVKGGWEFGEGAFKHGPVVSLLSQQIDIDAFAESEPNLSTSLAYPRQKFDSLIGSVGWQVSFDAGEHLTPYAELSYEREFEDAPEEAFAQLQSMPATGVYAVPGQRYDDSYANLMFGARTQLFGFDANLGASLTVEQDGGNLATVFATVGKGF